MSRFRDIADRFTSSSIGELLGQLRDGHDQLAHVDAAELEAELEARKAAGPRDPSKNPRAVQAGAGETHRAARAKAAEVREARIRSEREKREKAERAASEKAFRQAQERAAREAEAEYQRFRQRARAGGGASSSSSSSSGAGAGGRRPFSGFGGIGQDPELAKHYKTLNLPYGAEMPEVKSAYRKLMRKYHPDMHNQSAKKQKAATELSVQVTQAYNALEKALKD